jgi:predicted LPLAT superfamily acyltransferase
VLTPVAGPSAWLGAGSYQRLLAKSLPMIFRPCAVIPTHNHYRDLPKVVKALRAHDLTVFLVDDGSSSPAREAVAALHAPEHGVEVFRQAVNGGKGAAVIAGLRHAATVGFTHAVQIDADGQHDLSAIGSLVQTASDNPAALISGRPVYDASIPRGRLVGRWLTHVWVWIETLSLRIADSMCGFRVYPLAATLRVLDHAKVGQRMDFDTEIMVRLFWSGVATFQIPVRVTYPEGNTSNFRLLRDNWLISRMHTRLVLCMLLHLPSILAHRPSYPERAPHWASLRERGSRFGMGIVQACVRLLGRRGAVALVALIAGYFWMVDGRRRGYSRSYLQRLFAMSGRKPPSRRDTYLHFRSFAEKALDVFVAWMDPRQIGAVTFASPELIERLNGDSRGALMIVSHHGNAELSRACLGGRLRHTIHPLVHTRHARQYNAFLRAARPDDAATAIEVEDIGPALAIALKERVERGEWIAIAGDRTPFSGAARSVDAPFLGAPAPFSTGPYILASIMECPVYLLSCVRDGAGYRVTMELFAQKIELPRHARQPAIAAHAARYAQWLEAQCLAHPYQFYNFYDFWSVDGLPGQSQVNSAA